jgi:hypothetical protein
VSSREASKPPRISDRAFGLTLSVVLSAVALVRWLFFGGFSERLIAVAVAFLAAGLLAPGILMPLNRLIGNLTLRLAAISNYVLLAPFLWAVMTPVGLVMRVSGRDPMRRRFDPDSDSYLTPVGRKTTEETLRDMF